MTTGRVSQKKMLHIKSCNFVKLKNNLKTSWVCRATLEFNYRLVGVGMGLGWGWFGVKSWVPKKIWGWVGVGIRLGPEEK